MREHGVSEVTWINQLETQSCEAGDLLDDGEVRLTLSLALDESMVEGREIVESNELR